jgi:hypothetical protein
MGGIIIMKNKQPISLYTAMKMLEEGKVECRIENEFLIVNEEERHLIREKVYPTIPMDELDMLTFGKDYTMKGGIITLTNGDKYSLPLFH